MGSTACAETPLAQPAARNPDEDGCGMATPQRSSVMDAPPACSYTAASKTHAAAVATGRTNGYCRQPQTNDAVRASVTTLGTASSPCNQADGTVQMPRLAVLPQPCTDSCCCNGLGCSPRCGVCAVNRGGCCGTESVPQQQRQQLAEPLPAADQVAKPVNGKTIKRLVQNGKTDVLYPDVLSAAPLQLLPSVKAEGQGRLTSTLCSPQSPLANSCARAGVSSSSGCSSCPATPNGTRCSHSLRSSLQQQPSNSQLSTALLQRYGLTLDCGGSKAAASLRSMHVRMAVEQAGGAAVLVASNNSTEALAPLVLQPLPLQQQQHAAVPVLLGKVGKELGNSKSTISLVHTDKTDPPVLQEVCPVASPETVASHGSPAQNVCSHGNGTCAGSSPALLPSSSSSSLQGHPSPLLLPVAALQRNSSSSSSSGGGPSVLPAQLPSWCEATSAPYLPGAPQQPPPPLEQQPGATDLERFIDAASPLLPLDPSTPLPELLEHLTLQSVWDAFLDASLWGIPVATLGGPRGASTAFFVPFLSALQLFTTVPQQQQQPGDDASVAGQAAAALPSHSSSRRSSSTTGDGGGTSSSVSCSPPRSPSSHISTPVCTGSSNGSRPGTVGGGGGNAVAAVADDALARDHGAAGAGAGRSVDEQQPASSPTVPPLPSSPLAPSRVAAAAAALLHTGPGGRGRPYCCSVQEWPPQMELLVEHAEQESPFSRDPLSVQIEAMAGKQRPLHAAAKAAAAHPTATIPQQQQPPPLQPPVKQQQPASPCAAPAYTPCGRPLVGPDLLNTRLADLHPSSWFAVAWYPVYRIPDAPLTARFLAFYSLAPLLEALSGAAAVAEERRASGWAGGGGPSGLTALRLPVAGLRWYNLMGEHWLEQLEQQQSRLAASSASSSSSSSGGRSISGSGSSTPRSGPPLPTRAEVSPARASLRQAMLDALQAGAARLSSCRDVRLLTTQGTTEVRLYHPDYDFFVSRS